ncbi:hypothetical protein EDD18DRAFT_1109084 [Armillaria luteobubalina]|uniref:Uncharacterized protein n=1 Tax=Armillaria luteobubalina TaxID=153913 RepID=A0AA39PXD1_9AGAR|nr:hypothetical protein EDD18DRAFT_1109084 [Armillaria luteobubalina]
MIIDIGMIEVSSTLRDVTSSSCHIIELKRFQRSPMCPPKSEQKLLGLRGKIFDYGLQMGNYLSNLSQGDSNGERTRSAIGHKRGYFGEGSECMRNQMPSSNNVACRERNLTLVDACFSLALLLLVVGFVCRRHRCRKVADIESTDVHADVNSPVEYTEKVKSPTILGVVEDLPLA